MKKDKQEEREINSWWNQGIDSQDAEDFLIKPSNHQT